MFLQLFDLSLYPFLPWHSPLSQQINITSPYCTVYVHKYNIIKAYLILEIRSIDEKSLPETKKKTTFRHIYIKF
jgi:hypothetical protein